MTYDIEMTPPSWSRCECCDGLTVRLTRFVKRDDRPFAIYYVAYSNNHPENELAMLVSLGPWGEGSDPADRVAFCCRVRPTAEAYEVMLANAAESNWRDAEIVGKKLSRDEARAHEWKATCFEIMDESFLQDPSLRGYLHRAHCGEVGSPLEQSFGAPDVIFDLGPEKQGRTELGRAFASLDGERFFVRCLLPVPVEGYGHWCVGTWVELAKADYDHVRNVWDDPVAYAELHLSGTIANDLEHALGLPAALGTKVHLRVEDPGIPPWLAASDPGKLEALLSRQWEREAFEDHAVARGFL